MKVFTENQKFKKPIIYIGLVCAISMVFYAIYKDWELISSGFNDQSAGLLIGLSILLIVLFFIISIQLITRVDEKGVYYQFYPLDFNLKLIPWKEIENCYIRKYNGLSEHGGWGFRINIFKKKTRAYTTSGNQGLQLKLINGKNILIGTQKKDELQRVLNTYKSKFLKE